MNKKIIPGSVELLLKGVSPLKGVTLRPELFKNKYKQFGVKVNPLKGFTLNSGVFNKIIKYPDVSINPQKGFTLIEMLVVLGVLTLAVGAVVIFLTSVLKGTQKANATNEVKQNSQFIVESLERQIRGAQDAINMDPVTVRLASGTGEYTFIKCFAANNTKNSRVGVSIISDTISDPDIVPGSVSFVSISNDELLDGVQVENCALTVFSAYGSVQGELIPAVVSIDMDIIKTSERVDHRAKTSIQTTISLRQY